MPEKDLLLTTKLHVQCSSPVIEDCPLEEKSRVQHTPTAQQVLDITFWKEDPLEETEGHADLLRSRKE